LNKEDDPFAELMKGVQLAAPDDADNPFLKLSGPVRAATAEENDTSARAVANMEKATTSLQSCMRKAVVSLDDKASDVSMVVVALIRDCDQQVEAFRDTFKYRGGAGPPLTNMAIRVVVENRAPKWWQFWK
jgi:hypothetical protein